MNKTTWQRVKLGEIAEIISGGTPKTSVPEYWGGDIAWLSVADFNNGRKYVSQAQKTITEDGLKNSNTKILNQNDIIISARGTVGIVAMLKKPMAFNQTSYGITSKGEVDNDFIYYVLKNASSHLIQNSYGAVFDTITKPILDNLEISLPPLETQRKIAEILSSLDDKIDLLYRQNKTLESLALTLFRHTFIDNPKRNEWEIGKLGDYGNIICGKTPPKSQKEYFNGEIPFIKIPDMHHNTFIVKTTDTLTQKGLVFQSTKTLPPFSVCVSCIATVGLVSMNTQISQTNQQINSIVPHKEYLRYFLYCFMKESFNELQAMASGGTTTMNLNTTEFSKMPIPKPNDKELQDFHSCVKIYFDKIYNNSKQIQNLESLRDIMLPKLLSGEMEV